MVSVNYVCIGGNLTRDPELKYTPQGVAVSNFNVAVNEKYTDSKTGEKKEIVAFIEVVAWKKTAELAAEYLRKGNPVLVEGKLSQDNWETPEGQKRTKTKVTASKVHFLTKKGDASPEPIVVPDNDAEVAF